MDQDDIDLLEEEREIKRSWVLRPKEEKKKKKKTKKKMILGAILFIVVSLFFLGLGIINNKLPKQPLRTMPSNYTIAMKMAMVFFDAQKSGVLPPDNNLSWRGPSCLQDRINNRSLVGGFYNGGGARKLSFPMAFTVTLMSWSVIEYGPSYEAAGELIHAQDTILWGAEYLLNIIERGSDGIVSEIVSGEDKKCWIRPEDIDVERLVIICSNGCSHIAAEMAAALASASIVFKDKRIYSERLFRGAKTLYKYAEAMTESDTDSDSSMYWDEIIWGGAWLYYATGDLSYLHRVTNPDMAARAAASSPFGVFSWENKLVGAQLLLTRLRLFVSPGYPYEETLRVFHKETDVVMCSYLPLFQRFKRSKGGLIELNHGEPRPLQYAANAAFLALLYSDYLDAADAPGWYCGPDFYSVHVLRDFARTQIDYILGTNPHNMSYVVGYGERYPKHVHHRGASIPQTVKKSSCKQGWKWRDTEREDPNTIVGAMVAGPNENDFFQDIRSKYNFTEPSLPGNAGLAAALIALTGESRGFDKNSLLYAIPPPYPLPPPPPLPWTP